jgi:hypothetical protein
MCCLNTFFTFQNKCLDIERSKNAELLKRAKNAEQANNSVNKELREYLENQREMAVSMISKLSAAPSSESLRKRRRLESNPGDQVAEEESAASTSHDDQQM